MRISIATGPCFPVPAIQGGAVHRLWQGLAEEFTTLGHQVTILCRAYSGQPPTEVIQGVRYIRRGGFSQSPNVYRDLLKDLRYNLHVLPTFPAADILVTNDFWLPALAALRPSTGKIIVNVNRFPKGQYRLYPKAARFVAVSRPIQAAIAQQYPPAITRTRLIPNPIDTQIFSPPVQPRPEPQEQVILYVGRLHPEKGVHLLLDAFALVSQELPTVKLRIVGPSKASQGGGGDAYFNQLKLKGEGLNVEFIGPVFEVKKLADIYRNADLFCYPSLAETGEAFGVAPLEAMACGVVPVVSNLDCFKDFIESGKTGYIFNHRDSNPAQELSNTLVIALSNWKLTCAIAMKSIQKAQEYSYREVSNLYVAEFQTVLA